MNWKYGAVQNIAPTGNTLPLDMPYLGEVLLNTKQASIKTGMSISWLEKRRHDGNDAPAFTKIGKAVRYPLSEIDAWLERQGLQKSTSQTPNIQG